MLMLMLMLMLMWAGRVSHASAIFTKKLHGFVDTEREMFLKFSWYKLNQCELTDHELHPSHMGVGLRGNRSRAASIP